MEVRIMLSLNGYFHQTRQITASNYTLRSIASQLWGSKLVFPCKYSLQVFPASIPCKYSLQVFLTSIPCKYSLQVFLTSIPYKFSLRVFPACIPYKFSLQVRWWAEEHIPTNAFGDYLVYLLPKCIAPVALKTLELPSQHFMYS